MVLWLIISMKLVILIIIAYLKYKIKKYYILTYKKKTNFEKLLK